jgi:hypothetical protein
MNNCKKVIAGGALALFGLGSTAHASTIIGGNAADIASADNILDIVFAIDTSGSMWDDIDQIGSQAAAAIQALSCPDDIWVRARFFGVAGSRGSVFDEDFRSFLNSQTGVTVNANYTSSEDNGWAVNEGALYYPWFQGTEFTGQDTTGKDLFKAIVHIGDEGLENGSPINQADWDLALTANQTAIANDVFVFSWVTDDPTNTFVVPTWQALSEGGSAPAGSGFTGGSCNDTGGSLINGAGGLTDQEVANTIQDIVCTAGTGGTGGNVVPVPGTLLLLGAGLGMLGFGKRFSKKA